MKQLIMLERRQEFGIAVDYPQEGEAIASATYTFRIAGSASSVEAAIDGEEWRPCRRAAGYWWYDWSGYDLGRHQLLIRARPAGGEEFVFRTRRFRVESLHRRGGFQQAGEAR